MGEEPELKSVLLRATSTGLRVMGLRLSGYAVGFVASILIARALGPTGRGLYAYPVALLGIVMAFGHVGLEFAQIHLAGQGRNLRHMWANATVFSVIAGIACWAGVAGIFAVDPRAAGGLPLSWIVIPMGLVPLLLMSLYWASLLQLDGRLMRSTWASWYGVALQAVAIAIMFFLHDLTPFRVLLLQWLTNGSAWLFLLLACYRAGLVNLRIDRRLLRQSVVFGVKVYVAQVFLYLVLRVDQVLVGRYAGFRQLGLYALATTVAELLWLLTDPLAAALIPHMVQARVGDDRRLSFAMARLSISISAIAAVAGWFLAPLVIPVVYGRGFAGAVPALRLLLPGVVALAAARPLGAVRVKEGQVVLPSVLGLAALGLNVALNLVLLPRMGIRGTSIASSVCYGALALSYVAIARRRGVAGWLDLVPRPSDLRLLAPGRHGRRGRGAGRPAGGPAAPRPGGGQPEPRRHRTADPHAGLGPGRARPPGDGDLREQRGRPGSRGTRGRHPRLRDRLPRPGALGAAEPVSAYPPVPPGHPGDLAGRRALLPVLVVPARGPDRAQCPRARRDQLAPEPQRRRHAAPAAGPVGTGL